MTRDGARIPYTMVGEGTLPVLVLPGVDDAFYTVDTAPSLLASWYAPRTTTQRLLCLSRRQPIPAGYTPEQHAEDVRWAIEQLGWGPTALECNSAAGPIGQWMAVKYPELVCALILSSTLYCVDDYTGRISRSWIALSRQERWGELRWSIVAHTFNMSLWLFSPWYPFFGLLGPPRYPERLERILQPLLDLDNSCILSDIACPTLVMGGEDDRVIRAEVQREMARNISKSQLELYPGYGHGNDRENPDYPRAVTHFLQEMRT